MAYQLLIALTCFSLLSSRDAVTTPIANNLLPGGSLSVDVAAALKVLELASVSIVQAQSTSDSLPFATISYAQTIDGSM